MDTAEKIYFVCKLAEDIAERIARDIESGKIPDNWDGIELRWLFSDRANSNFGNLEKKRKKEYKNTVIVNGL